MGMNLDELEQVKAKKPVDVTKQVFGAQDYRSVDERYCSCDNCSATRWAVPGTDCPCGGKRILYSQRNQQSLPSPCNVVTGYWETCERGTVGCATHRRRTNESSEFFPCYIRHRNAICHCNQPVIVDREMLANTRSAAMHVLGALKPDAQSSKLNRDDLDYLAVATARIMAHWARKALGHKPEDEK